MSFRVWSFIREQTAFANPNRGASRRRRKQLHSSSTTLMHCAEEMEYMCLDYRTNPYTCSSNEGFTGTKCPHETRHAKKHSGAINKVVQLLSITYLYFFDTQTGNESFMRTKCPHKSSQGLFFWGPCAHNHLSTSHHL